MENKKKLLFEIVAKTAKSSNFDVELYFVNRTDETLELVHASAGGFATTDDDVIAMTPANGGKRFENVEPNGERMVDLYDMIFDSDFAITLYITVKSRRLGAMKFSVSYPRHTYFEGPLYYDDGTTGRHVWAKTETLPDETNAQNRQKAR